MNMVEPKNFNGLRGSLALDAPLARHTSWRAGGGADIVYTPADRDDLAAFLRQLPIFEQVTPIGLGSNTLIRDGGVRGAVILMHDPGGVLAVADGLVYAEAGVACPKLARFAALHGCSEAEFLAGVPGTVGGALAMNAGCYGGETWDIVERVLTMDRHGELRNREKTEYEIGYRHCHLRSGKEEWFLGAWFKLEKGDGEASRARIKELLARRIATQPLQLPNAGSVFRNPPGDHAARLIESCGLKGLARGGARVSEKHANFIVNPDGAATAADIEWLINTVKSRVNQETGVDLVPEVRIVGEPA